MHKGTDRTLERYLILGLVAALAGCATPRPVPAERPIFAETGIASWYGKVHDGHLTADGEAFDMNAMTAAHRSLPFGTVVRVTNLANGRSIKVRINDRGPYIRSRVIDLSARAARALGIAERGIARVRIEELASDQAGS